MVQAATSRVKNSRVCIGEYFVLPHWDNLFFEELKSAC